MKSDPVEKARAAWGGNLPDWVLILARACAQDSQNKVAKRLGYSPTVVSNVLLAKYGAGLESVEDKVRGVYDRKVVDCPALGELPSNQCRKWRSKARKLNSANAMNVTMFRACNRCPLHKGEPDEE